jgi:hypothetical protein
MERNRVAGGSVNILWASLLPGSQETVHDPAVSSSSQPFEPVDVGKDFGHCMVEFPGNVLIDIDAFV